MCLCRDWSSWKGWPEYFPLDYKVLGLKIWAWVKMFRILFSLIKMCGARWAGYNRTLSGLVLIRSGAFEGWLVGRLIRDTSPALPQYEGYVSRWTFALLRAFCCILLYSVFRILYLSIALFRWMGLGAAASDRGRRYCCVKGSASTSQLYIYVAGLPGSIQALRLNIFWQEKLGLSSTYMYPIYIHRYTDTHIYMLQPLFNHLSRQ